MSSLNFLTLLDNLFFKLMPGLFSLNFLSLLIVFVEKSFFLLSKVICFSAKPSKLFEQAGANSKSEARFMNLSWG